MFGRLRPEFDPLCIDTATLFGDEGRAGGLELCPSLQASEAYDSNVFRTDEDEKDDIFTRLVPELRISGDGEDYRFSLVGVGDVRRYAAESTNDSEDFRFLADADALLGEELILNASGFWGRFHEERDDPDSPGGVRNVNEFFLAQEALTLEYRPGHYAVDAEARLRQYDFLDNGPIDNDDRDRAEYRVTLRGGFQAATDILAFVQPSYDLRRYRRDRDSAGVIRDSEGFDVRAGLEYDFTGVTYLEATAGYFSRDFEDPALSDPQGISFGGRMVWNPTGVTTVQAELDRDVRESTLNNVSGVVQTTLTLGLDHEFLYNLLVGSRLTYETSEFEGTGRDDQRLVARLGVEYLINRYATAQVTYRFETRASNAAGEDFTSNIFLLTLRAHI